MVEVYSTRTKACAYKLHLMRIRSLAQSTGLPLVCVSQHMIVKDQLPCIILTANRRTELGDTWSYLFTSGNIWLSVKVHSPIRSRLSARESFGTLVFGGLFM